MKVTEIKYTLRKNLGNYEHSELTATAIVSESEDSNACLVSLISFVEKGINKEFAVSEEVVAKEETPKEEAIAVKEEVKEVAPKEKKERKKATKTEEVKEAVETQDEVVEEKPNLQSLLQELSGAEEEDCESCKI